MRPSLLLLLLVTVLLVVGCAAPVERAGPTPVPERSVLVAFEPGDPLPSVRLPYLEREGTLDTGALGDRPAVVNLWATWCTFCVEEMPELQAVHAEIGDEVRFIGVNVEDHHEKARRLAAETGVTYELVVDDDRAFFYAVKAPAMPLTLFVDRDGLVAHRHAGPLDADALRGLIAQHLGVGGRG